VVEYDQTVRPKRNTRFTFKKNWELAMISIIRFSSLPLRSIAVLGIAGLFFTCLYAVLISIRYGMGYGFPGWTGLILAVSFMGCLQLISLGILASYLQRLVFAKDLPLFILDEVKKTP
jgi:hypothetical protein